MRILSIVNLKGGVGKTTITANLGVMFGKKSRVLMIDLDYQRSLSLLCCSPSQIKEIHDSGHSLQQFLLDPHADAKRLLDCVRRVEGAEGCEIVINSELLESKEIGDNLEDAEMHLLAKWLTNPSGADIRLILRKALHSPEIWNRFDFVLLDCPPRLSTACINGLVASDFAIIPVMLDYTSTNSVPNLLRKLRRLRENDVLPELGILGIVANRVKLRSEDLVNPEAVVWEDLRRPCEEAWKDSVYFFKTHIKQDSAVAEAAARHESGKTTHTFAAQYEKLKPFFDKLFQEVTEEIEK
jgi:cellulose biosynthesis protein BcsQ